MVNKRKKSTTRRRASTSGGKPNIVIKHPGRVRDYMKRKYGKKAFEANGDINPVYIQKAENQTKSKSMWKALNLAKVMEKWRKRK